MITVSNLLEGKALHGVIRIPPTAMVIEALEVMKNHNIGAVLVMDGAELAGIFSERDYARKGIIQGRAAKSTPVTEVMTSKLFTVNSKSTIDDCMELFQSKRIRHIPVQEENGDVIGLLSIGDIVSAMLKAQKTHINFLEQYIGGA